jgi:hypothetical protein
MHLPSLMDMLEGCGDSSPEMYVRPRNLMWKYATFRPLNQAKPAYLLNPCSGLVRRSQTPGNVQRNTERPHHVIKTLFQLLAAHSDFGWRRGWIESL